MLGVEFPEILNQAQAGSAEDFTRIYRDQHPALLRYLTVLARDQADDVAADAWLAVVTNLDSFIGDENGFRNWLFTIARNKLIDAQRKSARRPTTPLTDAHDRSGPAAQDAAEQVVEAMSTERALSLIATLPMDQAEAVMLRVVAGLDVANAARIMNRSPGAVRVLSHRGLKRLAHTLAADQSEGSDIEGSGDE